MMDTPSGPSQARIRTDLWRAVLDFSGDEKYVWDQNGLVARRTSEATDPGPDMPTITPEQFTGWKKAFARGIDDSDRDERLTEWTERRLPASFLPPHLKHRWNGHLKDRGPQAPARLVRGAEPRAPCRPAGCPRRHGDSPRPGLAAAAHRLPAPDDPGRVGARADSCLRSAANEAVAGSGGRPDRRPGWPVSVVQQPAGASCAGDVRVGRRRHLFQLLDVSGRQAMLYRTRNDKIAVPGER